MLVCPSSFVFTQWTISDRVFKVMGDNYDVKSSEEFEETPFIIVLCCYVSYIILGIFGHLRDFLRETGIEKSTRTVERNRKVSWFITVIML